MGNIQLTKGQLKDRGRLHREAVHYAAAFSREEDANRDFHIGCSNWTTNRAFVLSIEAARLLAGGGDEHATKLLHLAIKEIADANKGQSKGEQTETVTTLKEPVTTYW